MGRIQPEPEIHGYLLLKRPNSSPTHEIHASLSCCVNRVKVKDVLIPGARPVRLPSAGPWSAMGCLQQKPKSRPLRERDGPRSRPGEQNSGWWRLARSFLCQRLGNAQETVRTCRQPRHLAARGPVYSVGTDQQKLAPSLTRGSTIRTKNGVPNGCPTLVKLLPSFLIQSFHSFYHKK
ncbi:hypothetical protein BT67DRAFT_192560 [Trichocladium antarcticum]|uniref:Uncharacterized protein n=1 Tax=Trichocladium antarcticum TaxID=1450529 RepID=A0AAN6ZF55_9PEZI|nr:hypothetical protein BT67DRAFT_192560 [Trichocladium antarcticum]